MFRCRVSFLILAWCGILRAQDAPTTGTIAGHVFSRDGTRLGGATVTIAGASTFVAVTETASDPGKYTSPAIPAGKYNLTVEKDGYRSPASKEVTVEQDGLTADFVMDEAPCDPHANTSAWTETVQTFWVVLLFLASIWLVRWNNIARPNREMLMAAIDNARVRFKDETGKDVEEGSGLDKLLKTAKDATAWDWWHSTIDFLFWSRGQEITGWARIREFERDAISELPAGKFEMIRARLVSAELDLLDIDKTHAKTIAANIKDVLALPTTDDPSLTAEQRERKKKEQEDVLRTTLVEALTYLNDEDVNTFAQLVGWQTKAVWLAGVGCSLVVVLTYAVGNPVLFIAGATGGYLSRLARALKRADVPTDYGASWTTLFLSPVVGGLSGWFGILLIVVLADQKFNVLGTAFQAVKWCRPLAPVTLGIAFALGFSERLFDGIISGLEKKVDQDREAATKPAQTGPSSTPKQAVPPGGPSNLVLPAPDPRAAPKPAPPDADK